MLEGGERADGVAAGDGGRNAFGAQDGEETRLPLGKLGEKSVWSEAGLEPRGDELQEAMHDIAEGAHGEAALGAIEGRLVRESRGSGIRKAVGGWDVEAV